MITLREYQQEAASAAIATSATTNALVSLPTGSGKSIVIAEICRRTNGRVLVLAHVQELIKQNAEKIELLTGEPCGVYCAGLGVKDSKQRITCASVQSIARAHCEAFRCIIVDEAHRIPHRKAGQYHAVFATSPRASIIGLTATPYRLDGGHLCEGDDRLFSSLAYNARTIDMIRDGWLSPIRSFRGAAEANLDCVSIRNGDFAQDEMADEFGRIITESCADIMEKSVERKATLIFCASRAHAKAVTEVLYAAGGRVEYLDGTMNDSDRQRALSRFRSGEANMLCNIDVLTTGFDQPNIDCIALLRATKSAGLYVQMLGRGLRKADGKNDCLLLDYGGNIRRHGPIDDISASIDDSVRDGNKTGAKSKTCPACWSECGIAAKKCQNCLHDFQVYELPKHDTTADDADPMAAIAREEIWEVSGVTYSRHRKPGKPDSLRVDYSCAGWKSVSEWICPLHGGYAASKAVKWFAVRGVLGASIDMALMMPDAIRRPKKIAVRITGGRFNEVVGYSF